LLYFNLCFDVYNQKQFSGTNAILAFEEEISNARNALNHRKKTFTAPVSGIYTSVFIGLKGMKN